MISMRPIKEERMKNMSPALERKSSWPWFHINYISQVWQAEALIKILLKLLLPLRIREV